MGNISLEKPLLPWGQNQPRATGLRARAFRILVLQTEGAEGSDKDFHQIKPCRMKYDLKDWMKPLGSLGRFKSSLVWKKRGSLVFSSVSASLMALPRGWSVLKIKHSGTDSILRCSELEKRRKSRKKRMDGAGSDVKNSPPALPGRAVSSQLSSHWGEMII